MLLPECVCGSSTATPVQAYGLAMLQCECGIMRQAVDMTPEQYADYYRTTYHNGVYSHTEEWDRAVAEQRLDAYGLPRNARILDVGAGNNAFVKEARLRGLLAWGQDMAQQADGPHTYVGALGDVHFPADHFDVVTLHDVLEHVPNPRGFLREIRRLLKPGGRLIVDFPRFHHESGVHHWKAIEHLWMLTLEQLCALLESEQLAVGSSDYPVPSKVVLHATNSRVDSGVRILVPPGIGDGFWVLTKLRGFLERHRIELPEVCVHDSGPRRAEGFWRRVPFVRWGGYAAIPPRDPALKRAYTMAEFPVQQDVQGFDWFLSLNGAMDHGRSVDVAIEGPTDWYPPMFRPKVETMYRDQFVQRFGDYIVCGFWDKGWYQKWLVEFGPDSIVAMLKALADAGQRIIITGAEWDAGGIGVKLSHRDPRFHNLIGETDFDELMGLIAGANGVIGFPAGSTLLGPYLRKPTVLLWHEHFPPAMWRNCVAPDAKYIPIYVKAADPVAVAGALLDLIAGKESSVATTALLRSRYVHGVVRSYTAYNARQLAAGLLTRRQTACGSQLAPGALQLDVLDLPDTLRTLGVPSMKTEAGDKLGALQWWPVKVLVGDVHASGWVLRHEHGRTPYLELVSSTPLHTTRRGQAVALSVDGSLPELPPTPKPAPKPPIRVPRPVPRPPPKPAARRVPVPKVLPVAHDVMADARRLGVTSPHMALVLGGGADVWKDARAAEELLGRPWDGYVVACNDIGAHWPGMLHHWATLHPEKMNAWIAQRKAAGHPDGFTTWARQAGRGRGIDRIIQPWNGGGSSGLLAVALAFHIGCTKLVLCGMPMNRTPHFAESKIHQKGKIWGSADSHWRAWGKNLDRMKDSVRSFSGRTKDLLGAPTAEWLLAGQEVAA